VVPSDDREAFERESRWLGNLVKPESKRQSFDFEGFGKALNEMIRSFGEARRHSLRAIRRRERDAPRRWAMVEEK
jgi:hypothetical protein